MKTRSEIRLRNSLQNKDFWKAVHLRNNSLKRLNLEELDRYNSYYLAFYHGHNQFDIEMINAALDYLLKPINHLELVATLKKFES